MRSSVLKMKLRGPGSSTSRAAQTRTTQTRETQSRADQTRGAQSRDPEEQGSQASDHLPESFPVVGVGASAGGLEAFSELLKNLPARSGMAFILVQHLDPTHTSELREILSRTTSIPVADVTDGVEVRRDHIYVIPPNSNMEIQAGVLRLSARTLTRGQHLPIDHFLRSLAADRGPLAISVILSGTASDGTEGSRAIKAAGGITFAQDATSAKYSSMPHSAISAGCVDFVVPPAAIANELARIGKHPYVAAAVAQRPEPAIASEDEMEALFSLVEKATGVDFTHYKHTTLHRRIRRRMVVHRLESLKDYIRYIRNTPGGRGAVSGYSDSRDRLFPRS